MGRTWRKEKRHDKQFKKEQLNQRQQKKQKRHILEDKPAREKK